LTIEAGEIKSLEVLKWTVQTQLVLHRYL
jgi:hypothetical protein